LPEPVGFRRARFFGQLYGYVDQSRFGRHRYERQGLLSAIPHVRLIRGALLIRQEHREVVEMSLGSVAKVQTRRVLLAKEDRLALSGKSN